MIALASDHAGFELKEALKAYLISQDVDVLDLGTDSDESVDYPDYGAKMGHAITDQKAQFGVLICGSGIGVSIAANRFPSVRSALCFNADLATLARTHNDANVLSLGARFISLTEAKKCVDIFLNTEFEGGRHTRRVDKLKTIEGDCDERCY